MTAHNVTSTSARQARRRRRLLAAIALLVLAVVGGAAWQALAERSDLTAYPPPGQVVDIGDGQRLHIHCIGDGSPTVLLEAGLGNDVNHWALLQPELARETRVCAYDRAGLGWSDPATLPRSPERIVDEIGRLLDASGETSPFILVGHSNGAAYVRLLAAARPADVAGLVLVDPNPELLDPCPELPLASRLLYGGMVALAPIGIPRAALPALFPLDRSALPTDARAAHGALRARTAALKSLWSETRQTCRTLAAVRATAPPRAGLPVVLLSAGRRPAIQQGTGELHRAMVAQWPGAELLVVEDSGHWIQLEKPEVAASAIGRVIEAVRAAR